MVPSLLLMAGLAQAQDLEIAPPVVPAAGIATEGGPGTLYVNPANVAYDPDPAWGVFYAWDPDNELRHSGAVVGSIGGLGGGFRWVKPLDRGPDFGIDLSLGVQLPERVAVGGALHWNILRDRPNHVAFDAAAAWRPLPWFGMGVVTRNIGNPGSALESLPETGVGMAVRPVGRALLLGADYLYRFGDREQNHVGVFTARVRPTSGLFLRAGVDTTLALQAGVELYFGGVGLGMTAGSADYAGAPQLHAWIGTDERDEHLAPPRRQVSVLQLDETPPYLPARRILRRPEPSWLETLEHFRRAETAPGVRGMLVTLGGADLSWARWAELRSAIRQLRVAGKDVTVLLTEAPGHGAIFAASAASHVLVHPAAVVDLSGLSVETLHLRGLLDAVGVGVDVARRSEFKSAAEGFTTTEPSPAAREQQEALLDDLYTQLVAGIAEGRARTEDDVRAWIDGGPWTAAEAVELGIADERAYPDQLGDHLRDVHDGRVVLIDLADRPRARDAWEAPDQIAVVYVDGPIATGESSPGGLLSGPTVGSQTIVEQLDLAARDVKTRAVVLRIDSPGGSTFASDAIWRAVQKVRAAGKPVVASLGGVAASGGYYVAVGADAIWAEPGTVTGSIGVIAIKPNVGELMDRLGVGIGVVSRGRNAGIDSPYRGWDPVQRARMQALVDDAYAMFKGRVAEGRGMDADAVEEAARGRVWSGEAARELGLVDDIGGLIEAVRDARQRAGIPEKRPIEVVSLRSRATLAEVLLPDLSSVPLQVQQRRLAALARAAEDVQSLAGPALHPLQPLIFLARERGEHLWMIDPSLLEVRTR